MAAYLLILVAILSRVIPHGGWLNFTALTGALLYFGARRSWREMLAPLAALMATDYALTAFVYHYPFRWMDYLPTWACLAATMTLGHILLKAKTTWVRAGAAVVLGPTSFWLVSNYAYWATYNTYAHSWDGLLACYVAAIPFYRNDLVSAVIIVGVAFGLPVLLRRMNVEKVLAQPVK